MSNVYFGNDRAKNAPTAKSAGKEGARKRCPFCSFVLSVYPNFSGMTERDSKTFTDHLTRCHGLKGEIPQ